MSQPKIEGSQTIIPIVDENIVLLCNGEIYNSEELFHFMDIDPITSYSYEVIIHLYKRYGIEHTLRMIDGTFSFLLLNNNIESENFKLYVARDSYGIKPLYILNPIQKKITSETTYNDDSIIGFSTDKHMLYEIYKNLIQYHKNDSHSFLQKIENKYNYELKQFLPGTYSSYILSSKLLSCWVNKKENIKFHMHGFNSLMYNISNQYSTSNIIKNIQTYLCRAIEKRCNLYGSHYACFLNGEIQNNIVAGLLNHYNSIHHFPTLKTFSIGFKNSKELENAKRVADYLGTVHTEFIITEEYFTKEFTESFLDLDCYNDLLINEKLHIEFIKQYLIGKYMKNEEIKFIFNGNGANEIFGSLEMMKNIEEPIYYDLMIRNSIEKLFLNHLFISDLSLYYSSYIPSSPFLDQSFVEYYLSIPPQIRFQSSKEIDKSFLRTAFSKENYHSNDNIIKEKLYFLNGGFTNDLGKLKDIPFLPTEIIWG
jgi:asparagine synthase (glutamine-hydrolysing)